MAFKTDAHGLALKINDAKVFLDSSTWDMRLSQIGRNNNKIFIVTYSLPRVREYATKILNKRVKYGKDMNVVLIANSKFKDRAAWLKGKYPYLRIALFDNVHFKCVLQEPDTVCISSENFGSNVGWLEGGIEMHSKEAFDYYFNAISKWQWGNVLDEKGDLSLVRNEGD